MISRSEAQEIDTQLLDLMRRRHMRQVVACRLIYQMSQEGYQALGYPTFRTYLRARGIPRSWAFLLKGVYHRLAVQLALPESAWLDIPLSRLQGALKIITAHNVHQVLADARSMSRAQFIRHVRRLRGVRRACLRGTYRLVPATRPDRVEPRTRRGLRGSAYASTDGTWYVDLRD